MTNNLITTGIKLSQQSRTQLKLLAVLQKKTMSQVLIEIITREFEAKKASGEISL
jgi:hypothetical protein